MPVEARDLEAPQDRRAWIDEDERSIPPRSGQAEQGVQARAVHEDELAELELQLVARREGAHCVREESCGREIEVSRQADASCRGKLLNLELGHHDLLYSRT